MVGEGDTTIYDSDAAIWTPQPNRIAGSLSPSAT
jgi:hypothetical protein